MSSEEPLSLSETSQGKYHQIIRRKSLDNLLKNKYITYSEEELTTMNNQRKDEVLQLNETNQKLKQDLTKIVEKLNKLITSNSEILFKEQDNNSVKIENLEKIYYLRKHDHSLSIKYNKTFKQQYQALLNKNNELGTSDDLSQKILEEKNNLQKIRNENCELNKKIQEIQFENVKQTKDLENSKFILKSENNMQNYTKQLNDSSLERFEYFGKIENKKKSVEQLKEQFISLKKYFKENNSKIIESNKADTALSKINSEMNKLKNELEKNTDEIIENCYNEKIKMLESNNNNNQGKNNILIKSNSQMKINSNLNKASKLKPLKNLQHSQSSIFNNSAKNNNLENNLYNIKTFKNLDTSRNKSKKNLSIFTKFRVLRANKPVKVENSVSYQPTKNISMFVTKEVIDFNKKSPEDKELEKEIQKIDENDYQQLIDLKVNYVDINDRLDKDIK